MSESRFRPDRARVLRAVAVCLVLAVLAGLVGARAVGLDRLPDVRSLPSLSMSNDLLVYDRRALLVGRGSALLLPDRHAAALSGTTDNLNDSWALGYTPSLASVVWVGNADYARSGAPPPDAFSTAPAAWHRFMTGALDSMHKGDEWYTPPAGLTSSVAGGRQLYFLPGTSASTPVPALPAWAHLAAVPPRPSPVPG